MDEVPAGRHCTRCGEWKQLGEYSPHGHGRYGKQSRCKSCSKAANRARYYADIEKSRERARRASLKSQKDHQAKRNAQRRAWAERNPEAMKEARRKWVEQNPERERAAKAAYQEAHKSEVTARSRLWREANPEKQKSAQRAYYEANKQEIHRKARQWEKANPEKSKASKMAWVRRQIENGNSRVRVANRRAKIRAGGGTITKADVEQLFAEQAGKCGICGVPLDRYELDHIIPVNLCGPTIKDNIQLLCRPCNRWKSDRHPDEILGLLPPHAGSAVK